MPHSTPELLAAAAIAAPSADNSQPFRYRWNGDHLEVIYDEARIGGKTFPADAPATLLALGAAIENVVTVAKEAGMTGVQWEPAPGNIGIGRYGGFRITESDTRQAPVSATASPVFARHTNRFPFEPRPLPPHVTEWIASETEQQALATTTEQPEKIREIAELVRLASEVRFQTREAHELLGQSLRFSRAEAATGDGLDVRTLALPPGGGLFLRLISSWKRMSVLNRFGVHKLLARIDSTPVSRAPLLIAICAPDDNDQIVAAGRLLCRIWMRLNMEGIAVHPYYVIPDQLVRLAQEKVPGHLVEETRSLQKQVAETLESENRHLQMLLRVGYPTRTPPRSARLSLDILYSDTSHIEE